MLLFINKHPCGRQKKGYPDRLMDKLEEKLKRIENWWKGENKGRPLFKKTLPQKHNDLTSVFDIPWTSEKETPDFNTVIVKKDISKTVYLGEAYPAAPHTWGARGTPMTMAAYLGGRVAFREDTVWVEPVVENWEDFPLRFDKRNHWVEMSRRLMEKKIEECDGSFLVSMPAFGDALTCMSLMRGTEKLLFDIMEKPSAIKEKVTDFAEAWKEAHSFFHAIYREKLPGDSSWLIWAPGKLCVCECDFSTMISPSTFEGLVVPELEILKNYAEYFIWHLDGFEEVRHLDVLLGLPYLNAVQIAPPPAGKPPCASDTWIPVIRKITDTGRGAYVYANNEEEVKTLVKNLPCEQLFIDGGFPGKTVEEAGSFINSLFPGTI